MRLLFYCQHSLGMGHLVRAFALVEALSTAFEVTFLNGGPLPAGIPFPAGVTRIDLPPLGMDDAGVLVSRAGAPAPDAALLARRDILLEALARTRPDVLLLEMFPFGRHKFLPELRPLLEAAHDLAPRPVIVSSVRDLLVTGRRAQARHDDQARAWTDQWFDAVIVHGDPRFATLEETFRPQEPLRTPVYYSGLVAPAARQSARGPADATGVLVSAGGGIVGASLVGMALDAHDILWRRLGLPMTIVAGPFLPDADWQACQRRATGHPGLTLRRAVPDLLAHLRSARVSVSQCGYNTSLDILRAGIPAIVVPYAARGEDEQCRRADRLAALGLVSVLAQDTLDATTLAAAIEQALGREVPTVPLDLEGAARTTTLLTHLAGWPAARPSPACTLREIRP